MWKIFVGDASCISLKYLNNLQICVFFNAGVKQDHPDRSISCFQGLYMQFCIYIINTSIGFTMFNEFLFSNQLFAANQNKPADIANILVANKSKLLRLLGDLKTDKGI